MVLLNINDFAREIKASPCKVRRLIKAKKVSYRKIGSRLFFMEEDLVDFLKNCKVPVGDHNKEVAL